MGGRRGVDTLLASKATDAPLEACSPANGWKQLSCCGSTSCSVFMMLQRGQTQRSRLLRRYICTFVCLEASKQTVCGKPAKGEHRAGAHPEKPRRSQPAPRVMRDTAACAGTQAEAPQKHPDRVRRPVGGGALLALPARTGAKCKHDAADELRRASPVDGPHRALIRSVGSSVRRCAQPARILRCVYVCFCVCELTRRPVSRWRLRAPLERKKNGEGT